MTPKEGLEDPYLHWLLGTGGQADSNHSLSIDAHAVVKQRLEAAKLKLKACKRRTRDADSACQKHERQVAEWRKAASALSSELEVLVKERSNFSRLVDVLNGDAVAAQHIWAVTSFVGSASCGLHIDTLDLPHMWNLVGSIGVDREGRMVNLRGAMLMVILAWSTVPLGHGADKNPPPNAAFDGRGNVVYYDPPALKIGGEGCEVVPRPARAPRSEAEAIKMMNR